MSYTVFLHPVVLKFLKKLPKSDVERIKTKITELTEPHSVKAVKLVARRPSESEWEATGSSTPSMMPRRSLSCLKSTSGREFTIGFSTKH